MRPRGRYSRQAFGAKASLPTPTPLVAAKMVEALPEGLRRVV